MFDTSEKISFWDRRILAWEERHYKTRFSSISQRQRIARQYLENKVEGLKILEIGCGSGLLASSLVASGAQSYTGIDLSPVAIENASRINSNTAFCKFLTGDLEAASHESFDLIFSLGLMDWLSSDEQKYLAKLSKNKLFLHSFTEKMPVTSFFNMLHRLYSKTYARPSAYEPIHQHRNEVLKLFPENVNVVRSPKMFISSFVTNL